MSADEPLPEPPPDPHRDVEYYVICRQALPTREGGWNLEIGTSVMVREIAEIPPSLRNAAGAARITQCIYLRSTQEFGRLCAQLAAELSSSSRGLVVAQAGWEAKASHRTLTPKWTRTADLERALTALHKKERDED